MTDLELYHWKYIKREKVGGKWKYTYDTEGLKRDAKNFVNDPLGTKAKQTYRQAQQNKINAQNRVSGRLMSDVEYREASKGNGPKTTSVTNRAAREKAVNAYRSDQVKLAVAKGKEKLAKEMYDKSLLGKLEKTSDNMRAFAKDVKDTAKDKLGYDEREALDKAQQEVNETSSRKAVALLNAKDAYDYAERYGNDDLYETRADEYANAKTSHDKAVSKRDRAKEVYYDTPIGKLAEATEKLELAKDYVEDLFKKKRSVNFHSTANELTELEEFERMLNKRKK